jgi:dynein assembly factor with WDR repeat domains 1
MFAPQGTRVLTASEDFTCRIWDVATGACTDTLAGHSNDIVAAAFNYAGDRIITASQDNTVIEWKAAQKDVRH